ncbi:MAG: M48 family metalloprotease [Alphaproteobacteria bacterium]|nr:M48 family metalloprotease [Alphaproteobacteria bacterium]
MAVRPVLAILAAVLPPLLGGCAINPATGGIDFMLVSTEEEEEIGRKSHPQVLAEFGGVYYDPGFAAYVEEVGHKIAAITELQDFEYRFTVLDSPTVNAFALPGGYIYVTRGLLALVSSEAELAGVLSHELAHVNARHGAQRLSGMKAEDRICATIGCDFELPVLGDTAAVGIRLAFGGFTQDQELEADRLGLRYLVSAGYDPRGMAGFLRKLKAQRDLDARIAGLSEAQRDSHGYSSTHPLTEARIEQAIALIEDAAAPSGYVGDTVYLGAIDGLLYGNRREYGFVIGRKYAHPIRRVTFTVPQDYTLYTDSRRVTALGPGGAIILFEPSRLLVTGPVVEYLTGIWAARVGLEDVREFTINGLPAATGWLRSETAQGPVDFRLVAVRAGTGEIYRFLFLSPTQISARLSESMRRTTYSFRTLDEDEAATLHPRRLRIVTAGANDTLETMIRLNAFPDHAMERFAILNDLGDPPTVRAGRLMKLVRD